MPVDPRSDLPVRIAHELSKAIGQRVNPSAFYAYDDGDFQSWHSTTRYDYERSTNDTDAHFFHNRRVTCFDLLVDPFPKEDSPQIPMKVEFNQNPNMNMLVIARCAIHEVYDSPIHNFEEDKKSPNFGSPDEYDTKKIGVELTLDKNSDIFGKTFPNGSFCVFNGSTGDAAKLEGDTMHYDSREHGTKLVNFAIKHIQQSYAASSVENTPTQE